MVEHSTADREVNGSIPVAPFQCYLPEWFFLDIIIMVLVTVTA